MNDPSRRRTMPPRPARGGRASRRRSAALARATGIGVALVSAAALLTPAAAADDGAGDSSARAAGDWLAGQVTGRRVYDELRHFQRLADENGGSRAAGEPGEAATAAHVADRLRAGGYRVTVQSVPITYVAFDTEEATETSPGGGALKVLMTRYAPSTPAGGLTAPVAAMEASRTGCTVADYPAERFDGALALVARTSACPLAQQEKAAADAGARALLVWQPTPSPEHIWRYQAPATGFRLPVASVTQKAAEQLADRAAAGRVELHLTLRARRMARFSQNVLAETSGGRPDRVVMMGAHLDGVTEGAGMNDNATAAAAVLQTALRLAPRQGQVTQKVRFAFWGAEELQSVGSASYLSRLSGDERRRIRVLLNGELLGSPNDVRRVWRGASPGSDAVSALFQDWFTRRGLPFDTVPSTSLGSDHLVFDEAGIAVGGLDAGLRAVKTEEEQARYGGRAGQLYDPCYHQPCDDLGNVNARALGQNAPALAYALGYAAYAEPAADGTFRTP
ncbi:M28 family peptidase [Streptomyces sp. NPDC048612]|uniref:M28 family peptidase n=1 Tax=Streptomyces sp. NPDC048612 TaxID=3365579 RepID=UPI0037239581